MNNATFYFGALSMLGTVAMSRAVCIKALSKATASFSVCTALDVLLFYLV